MRVSGRIIQNRIIAYTNNLFRAVYKGKEFYISSDHGFGKPEYSHLTRYFISVTDIESGWADVDTYEDCHNIHDAIRFALEGACLIQ